MLRHGTPLAFGTCVIDGDIQLTKSRNRLVDQVSYIYLVAYVRSYEFSLCFSGAEIPDQLLAGFVASTGDNDTRAFLRKDQSDGASDACKRTGDQNNVGIHSEFLGGRIYRSVCLMERYILDETRSSRFERPENERSYLDAFARAALGGLFGSSKEVCAVKRARPSSLES